MVLTYSNYRTKARGSNKPHYPDMTVEQVASIPVADWMANDAIIHLCCTWPKLRQGIEVLESWNLQYVTAYPWIKSFPNRGTIARGVGIHQMACSEVMLIGKRGKPPVQGRNGQQIGLLVGEGRYFFDSDLLDLPADWWDPTTGIISFPEDFWDRWSGDRAQFIGPRGTRHSGKEGLFIHERLELLDGPYLELFARTRRPGWTCWGCDFDDDGPRYALGPWGVEELPAYLQGGALHAHLKKRMRAADADVLAHVDKRIAELTEGLGARRKRAESMLRAQVKQWAQQSEKAHTAEINPLW